MARTSIEDRKRRARSAKERAQSAASSRSTQSSNSTSGRPVIERRSRPSETSSSGINQDVRDMAPGAFNPFDQVKSMQERYSPAPKLSQPPTAPPTFEQQVQNVTRFGPMLTENELKTERAKDIPVLGLGVRALDAISESKPVEKFSDLALEYYTPGSVGAPLASAYRGIQKGIAKVAPKLVGDLAYKSGLGQVAAREALTETILGAPLTAGNVLARNPGVSGEDFATEVALGTAAGGVFGAAAPYIGRGLGKLAKRGSKSLNEGASVTEAPAVTKVEDPIPDTSIQNVSKPEELARPQVARRGKSEQPIRPKVERVQGERAYMKTLDASGKLADETAEGLRQSKERNYDIKTNQQTLDRANEVIAKGIDQAETYALNASKGQYSPEQVVTGIRLIDEFQRTGNYERAVNMAEQLAKQLTEAGQTIQAASVINRLSPEGALIRATRIVERVNESRLKGQKPVEITPDDAQKITEAATSMQQSGISSTRAGQVMDITARLKGGESISEADQQIIDEFVADLKNFTSKKKDKPRPVRAPKEVSDKRVRDRLVDFMAEQEAAARERMRARGNRVSSTPFDVWYDMAVIMASKMTRGARDFTDLSAQMISEYGEEIRPQLRSIYDKAQELYAKNAKTVNEQVISKAERIASQYVKKNAGKLSDQDIEFINGLAQKVSALSKNKQREASMDLQEVLNGFERAGIGRKLSAAQYVAMLLNPLTQIRNIVGNEMMYRLERLQRNVSSGLDMVTSPKGKRTITASSGNWEDFFKPTADYYRGLFSGAKAGWRGVNPEGLSRGLDVGGQAFKSKWLTYFEKSLGAVMQGFDYASYNRATQQRLREMANLDAINKGIPGAQRKQHVQQYLANLEDNVLELADKYGRFVTLQDDTKVATGLQKAKQGLNWASTLGRSKEFGAGNAIIPFAKTPGNLLMRAIDYSPFGMLKALGNTYDVLFKKNTDLTKADVIESVTRSLLGTGMGAAAWWLADKGVLKGASSSDRDVRELEKKSGLTQYQLNGSALKRMLGELVTGNLDGVDEAAKLQPGDVLWAYDWAQPSSMPMAIGANISQERKEYKQDIASGKNKPQNAIGSAVDVALGAGNTLLNSSVLSGLQDAFDFQPGEENKLTAVIENVIKQVPGMMIPSVLNQINKYRDNQQRETYSPDYWENMLNPSQAKIPGLAQELPAKYDTLGEPVKNQNSFFDVFLNPAKRNEYKPSETAREVLDLINETGDKNLAPRAVGRTISGRDASGQTQKVELTGEQLARYQKLVGEKTAELLAKAGTDWSTETKMKFTLDMLDKAGQYGRYEMKKELGLR